MSQGIAHEVHATALPCRSKHLGNCCLESFMGIRDDQLDTTQAAACERAEELGPERLGFAVADDHAQHFTTAVRVDRHGDDHRHLSKGAEFSLKVGAEYS